MEVKFKISDSYNRKAIHVLAGIELVAYKLPDKLWMIKTSRCSMCGQCCKKLSDRFIFPVEDGRCIHLVKRPAENKYLCGLGQYRPVGCSAGRARNISECTEKFETCE